ELSLWHSLEHDNILSFKGVCYFPTGLPDESLFSMVSPWMRNGTIKEYIKRYPSNIDRICLLYEIINGLKYLHGKNIVHADLKGANIFITDDGHPVLADFGLSKLMEADTGFFTESLTSSTTNLKGTARFMAPELVQNERGRPSCKTDIWAFGCVILVSRIPSL
ncbi:kinase-like protein, partial [Sistotremastrum suecicum HHB10207 ss-3]